MRFFKHLAFVTLFLALIPLQLLAAEGDIVRSNGSALYRGENHEAYYVRGANMWYAPLLGCKKTMGDRKRLAVELDSLQALGINSLRVLAGVKVEQSDTLATQMTLTAESNDEAVWKGMDQLLAEAKKRDMTVVISLANQWRSSAVWLSTFTEYIKAAASRVNSVTKEAYHDDATILAWELCDAPRMTNADEADAFATWVSQSAEALKSVDKKHLVCIGLESENACLGDERFCNRLLNNDNVDMLTLQLNPLAQGWTSVDRLFDAMPNVIIKTNALLEEYERMARKLGKPVLITSFVYPRDNNFTSPGTRTYARDSYFDYMFSKFEECRTADSPIVGGYFKGWGGMGYDETQTKASLLYVGDLPAERRGASSVYNVDASTMEVIRKHK